MVTLCFPDVEQREFHDGAEFDQVRNSTRCTSTCIPQHKTNEILYQLTLGFPQNCNYTTFQTNYRVFPS